MRSSSSNRLFVVVATSLIGLAGCAALPRTTAEPVPIVGTWVVRDPMAPFPYHMYVFNADGTMQQANPDAGDPHSSDSDGKGVWAIRGDRVVGRWVEITADRTTHKYSGRNEISFEIRVTGDTLSGTESAKLYDANEKLTELPAGPVFHGTRVTLPSSR